jgi:hypothetical protein
MKKAKSKSASKKPPDNPQKQHARFVEAAMKAEADQRPDAMDAAFKRLDLRKKQ